MSKTVYYGGRHVQVNDKSYKVAVQKCASDLELIINMSKEPGINGALGEFALACGLDAGIVNPGVVKAGIGAVV